MNLETFQKVIREDILLYTLICYALGLLYHLIFYSQFNIPILYYISLTDILLSSIKTLAFVFIVYGIFEGLFYGLLGNSIKYIVNKIVRKNYSKEEVYCKLTTIVLFSNIFISYFFNEYLINSYHLIFALLLAPLFIFLEGRMKIDKNLALFDNITGFILIYSLILMFLSYTNSLTYIKNKDKVLISFTVNEKKVSTQLSGSLYYLGETSSNIFVYDTLTKDSEVYFKSELRDLKYH